MEGIHSVVVGRAWPVCLELLGAELVPCGL